MAAAFIEVAALEAEAATAFDRDRRYASTAVVEREAVVPAAPSPEPSGAMAAAGGGALTTSAAATAIVDGQAVRALPLRNHSSISPPVGWDRQRGSRRKRLDRRAISVMIRKWGPAPRIGARESRPRRASDVFSMKRA